jgi:ATP-dependent RNA helicase DDX3X
MSHSVLFYSQTLTGSKYVPPHLRNQGGGSSNTSDEDNKYGNTARVGYGTKGSFGYDRRAEYDRKDQAGSVPAPSSNSRWNNVDMGSDSRGAAAAGGGGGRGYGRTSSGYGGGYGRGSGPRVNERGYHGDTRPDPRLERQLFQRDDVQTTGINFDNYDDIPVETTGNDIPAPINDYSIDTIGEDLMRNTQLCGYSKPTPVQKYSVPIGLAGRDLMACAQTGSG